MCLRIDLNYFQNEKKIMPDRTEEFNIVTITKCYVNKTIFQTTKQKSTHHDHQ